MEDCNRNIQNRMSRTYRRVVYNREKATHRDAIPYKRTAFKQDYQENDEYQTRHSY